MNAVCELIVWTGNACVAHDVHKNESKGSKIINGLTTQ